MDPGRRNYGGLHEGSRSFYLGLRGTRLLGLYKCLLTFLFLGEGNIMTMMMELRWLSFIQNWMDGLKIGEVFHMWSEFAERKNVLRRRNTVLFSSRWKHDEKGNIFFRMRRKRIEKEGKDRLPREEGVQFILCFEKHWNNLDLLNFLDGWKKKKRSKRNWDDSFCRLWQGFEAIESRGVNKSIQFHILFTSKPIPTPTTHFIL